MKALEVEFHLAKVRTTDKVPPVAEERFERNLRLLLRPHLDLLVGSSHQLVASTEINRNRGRSRAVSLEIGTKKSNNDTGKVVLLSYEN